MRTNALTQSHRVTEKNRLRFLCVSVTLCQRRSRGSALLSVLWLSAALAAIAFSLSSTVRGETERTGTGVGVFRFCGDVGFTLGPVVAGLTTTAFGFEVAFTVAAVPTVIALLLALRTEETLSSARAGSRSA